MNKLIKVKGGEISTQHKCGSKGRREGRRKEKRKTGGGREGRKEGEKEKKAKEKEREKKRKGRKRKKEQKQARNWSLGSTHLLPSSSSLALAASKAKTTNHLIVKCTSVSLKHNFLHFKPEEMTEFTIVLLGMWETQCSG